MIVRQRLWLGIALTCALQPMGCRDVTRFSSSGDHFEGTVITGSFVRAGLDSQVRLCLVLDASDLQGTPGTVTSSDGRFSATPLRPIPQLWNDPLSTLTFGEGRVQNLMYVLTPAPSVDALGDIVTVVSLMQSGDVEVRLLRSAPAIDGGAGAAALFGVFAPLSRVGGPCPF
jgi:hypothetical protein